MASDLGARVSVVCACTHAWFGLRSQPLYDRNQIVHDIGASFGRHLPTAVATLTTSYSVCCCAIYVGCMRGQTYSLTADRNAVILCHG